jgi:hypothetical protein
MQKHVEGHCGVKVGIKEDFERDLEARGIMGIAPTPIVSNKPNRKYKSKKEKGEYMVWWFILGKCSTP